MSTVSAGRVMPLPKGTYDANTTYHVLDIVSFNNSSYICKQTSQGNLPTNTTYWQLIASGSAVGSLNDIGDVSAPSPNEGDVLVRQGSVWVNAPAPSTGLRHLVISTTTGSTVTVTKGTTTINAAETSTGVFESDVPEYGTWTVTATLSGQTATATVVVDTAKIYNVNCNYFSATITVAYPSGATCTLSASGQSTQTATTNPQAFVVHATGTYTIMATDGVATSTQTVTITTDGQTESVTLTFFTATITVTYPAGATCTLSATGQSTQTATTNPYTFTVHAAAEYTITATDGEDTASDTVTITTDGQSESVTLSFVVIPDGSTVLPINDVPTWLSCCASTSGSTHTTLAQVLADSTELNALLFDQNACNYLVRCKDWIAKSLVPVMTSDNTPSGECFASTEIRATNIWKAFDHNDSTHSDNAAWTSTDGSWYFGYKFASAQKVKAVKIRVYNTGWNAQYPLFLKSSNTNASALTNIQSLGNMSDLSVVGTDYVIPVVNDSNYLLYAIGGEHMPCDKTNEQLFGMNGLFTLDFLSGSYNLCDNQTFMQSAGASNVCADTLLADADWLEAIANSEYIEKVLNVKVPTMTSNTTPSGVASAHTEYGTNYAAWKAFDGVWGGNGYASQTSDADRWLQYQFAEPVVVHAIHYLAVADDHYSRSFSFQGSNDGTTFTTFYTGTQSAQGGILYKIPISNDTAYSIYRMTSSYTQDRNMNIPELQFYGREDV